MQSLQQIIDHHGLIDAFNFSNKLLKKTSISFNFDPIYLTCNESKFSFKHNEYIYVDIYGNQKFDEMVYVDIDITIKKNYDRRKTI